jgi:apolipoprotein N-acyltransferase
LYFLKFSWLSVGYAFSYSKILPYLTSVGVYGIGFCAMLLIAGAFLWRRIVPLAVCLALFAFMSLSLLDQPSNRVKGTAIRVAGVQLENPAGVDALHGLDKAFAASPHADVYLLPEYTFHSPIPNFIKKWCVSRRKYLVIGGTDPLPDGKFYDTDFVIGPSGDIVFKQAKCVPVQFFQDGLPAREQKLWNSPWGKIGLGICYDCSYRRVTDELVRQHAQALIFPTLDGTEWGAYEHRLHARVGPMRAAEFGIPVIRMAGSGISQIVGRDGTVATEAGFPGQGSTLIGTIGLGVPGRLPFDHWIAPVCTGVAGLVIIFFVVGSALRRKTQRAPQPSISVPVAKV